MFGMPAGPSYNTGTLSICRVCNMKISEMMNFLDHERLHMQQGLFPDVQQMYLLHSSLNFDEVSLRALAGAPLKSNDFLKLEQTCLADVIVEEGGNEHLRGGSWLSKETSSQVTPVIPSGLESGITKVSCYSIVWLCNQRKDSLLLMWL